MDNASESGQFSKRLSDSDNADMDSNVNLGVEGQKEYADDPEMSSEWRRDWDEDDNKTENATSSIAYLALAHSGVSMGSTPGFSA